MTDIFPLFFSLSSLSFSSPPLAVCIAFRFAHANYPLGEIDSRHQKIAKAGKLFVPGVQTAEQTAYPKSCKQLTQKRHFVAQ